MVKENSSRKFTEYVNPRFLLGAVTLKYMDLNYQNYRRIYKLSENGKTPAAIAIVFSIRESAVINILSKPFSKLTPEDVEGKPSNANTKVAKIQPKIDRRRRVANNQDRDGLIIELRKQGLTLEEIGEKVNLTRERVRQVLRRDALGIDMGAIKREQEVTKKDIEIKERKRIFTEIDKNWNLYRELTLSNLAIKVGVDEGKLKRSISRIQYVYLLANQESKIVKLWTDEQCIQSLKDAATFAFPLTVLKYRRLIESGTIKGPTVALFWQRFGSWVNACDLAGVEYGDAQREYDRIWTDRDLLRFVRWFMFQRKDGRWSIQNFETWSKEPEVEGPSVGLLRLRLGTWTEIRVLALELSLPEFNMHAFAGLETNDK